MHLEIHLLWYNIIGGTNMIYEYTDEEYIVIIGDIINSRKIADRKVTQKKLIASLETINDKYDLAAEFIISLGDEFQGLLRTRENVMQIISDLESLMDPISIRFGIGIGSIDTEINFKNSLQVDGTAYQRARKMVESLKEKNQKNKQNQSNVMIESGDEVEIDELLNSILSLCTAIKSKWTVAQKKTIYTHLSNNQNQYETAKLRGLEQSTISRQLKSAQFYDYKAGRDTVDSFLRGNRER